MFCKVICLVVFLAWAYVKIEANVEVLPFWDLTTVKKWDASGLPKEMNADWHLGLATFSCAIQKQKSAKLNMTPTASLSLNYFSIIQLYENSQLVINDGSILDLKDQSEFSARESSYIVMEPRSTIELHSSKLVPGSIKMETGTKISLTDTKFTSLLASFNMLQDSFLKADSRTQITFLGGSKVDLGKSSSITTSRSSIEIAAEVHIGERSTLNLQGSEFNIVVGVINMGKKVEFKAESRSAFIVSSSQVNFTEGAKINLGTFAEFNMERNSSLIMARRDLRLKIEDKGLLKITTGAHCLMTDDLTVPKQSTKTFASTTDADSFRCFTTMQKLIDEKRLHFPEN